MGTQEGRDEYRPRKKSSIWFYLLSRDGYVISNGCILTWIVFALSLAFWVRYFFDPSNGDAPQSLRDTFEALLFYLFGGTAAHTAKTLGSQYFTRKSKVDNLDLGGSSGPGTRRPRTYEENMGNSDDNSTSEGGDYSTPERPPQSLANSYKD